MPVKATRSSQHGGDPNPQPGQELGAKCRLTDAAEVVALSADQYGQLLQNASERRIAGGRVYDAVIVAAAGGVDVVLTFNQREFQPIAGAAVRFVIPPQI